MRIEHRNLFRATRFLILYLPYVLRITGMLRFRKKRLLIIKTDAIGDYILFRNFIEIVKTSAQYKDYKIDLLGNAIWKDIALAYDYKYINQFIFINPDLYESPGKMLGLAWQLFFNNYERVLHPTSSRTLITDGLAGFTGSKIIIGFEGDAERIRADYKLKTDRFYTELLKFPAAAYAEFERTKFFFETVIGEPIAIENPEIKINVAGKNGIVIFPGSGADKRNWEADKFRALLELIVQNTKQHIYLAGGNAEVDLCRYLSDGFPADRVQNLSGKTSLPQLIELIAGACLLISNETCAIQIAAAVKTTSICILGGGHFNRFIPYKAGVENESVCVHEKMACYNCNWECQFVTDANAPYPCISAISLENVWKETITLLN